jgi:hypothetical protein
MKKIGVWMFKVLLPTIMLSGLAASFVLNHVASARGSAFTAASSNDPQGTSCYGKVSPSDSDSKTIGSAGKEFSGCAAGHLAICGETVVVESGCSTSDRR